MLNIECWRRLRYCIVGVTKCENVTLFWHPQQVPETYSILEQDKAD